jgi:hypothetical protein
MTKNSLVIRLLNCSFSTMKKSVPLHFSACGIAGICFSGMQIEPLSRFSTGNLTE